MEGFSPSFRRQVGRAPRRGDDVVKVGFSSFWRHRRFGVG
jgi:hypothetical protein